MHAAVIYDGTSADAHALGASMFERWHAGITAAGFDALAGPGLDVQVAGDSLGKLGLYLAKLGADLPGLAREVTQGGQKQARGKNRTPFQIAADAVATGDAQDTAIWAEWTRTAPGHRALTWSKNARQDFGLTEPETDDETLAAHETGTTDDTILVLPAPTWHVLRHHAHTILDTAENHGPTALKNWLTSHGYTWHHPPQPPPSPTQLPPLTTPDPHPAPTSPSSPETSGSGVTTDIMGCVTPPCYTLRPSPRTDSECPRHRLSVLRR